jgi:type IV secretory pathway VirB10-like protein
MECKTLHKLPRPEHFRCSYRPSSPGRFPPPSPLSSNARRVAREERGARIESKRERERNRQTDRERERERERETGRQTETEREREREKKRQTDREREREREKRAARGSQACEKREPRSRCTSQTVRFFRPDDTLRPVQEEPTHFKSLLLKMLPGDTLRGRCCLKVLLCG